MMINEPKKQSVLPLSVFISYAHEDESLRQQLEIHLSLLRRQGLIAEWHDRKIMAGGDWARDIDEHLMTATIILLLISSDFLASDYCYGIEMHRSLDRHKNGEAQVIPILLRPVDWEGAPFSHLQCLPRDAQSITEWPNRDAAFRDVARGIRAAIEQPPVAHSQPQNTPTSPTVPPTTTSRRLPPSSTISVDRNRQRMLKHVHATWIAGVLAQSLHGVALMALGLEEKADVLDNPWRLLLQEVDRPAQPLPEGTRITEVYNATEGGLLILGEPGAGKTTLLLELARDLLEHAQNTENTPIPVVFNLSSWAKKRQALGDWLVEELNIRYEVPRKLGRFWVSDDRLLLLLDGLDEVEAASRRACIEAINNYRQAHPDVQVIVCSRVTEYLNEPVQLRLHTAVVVQPLTQVQIDSYLESAGEQAHTLREALRHDADLRALATTPLMLTILLFAYRGSSLAQISELATIDAKREQVFTSYVQHMLKRRGASTRYTFAQITHWISYLARQMKRQDQTIFYLEQLQSDWLPKQWQRYVYRALAGATIGVLLGALIGIAFSVLFTSLSYTISEINFPWPNIATGAVTGLLIGLNLGLLTGLFHRKSTEIRTAEVITWSWPNVRLAAIASIIGGSLGWLTLSHFSSIIRDLLNYIFLGFIDSNNSFSMLIFIFTLLFINISFVEISFGFITLLTRRNSGENGLLASRQSIWYIARRGVLVGLYTGCISYALFLLTSSMAYSWESDIRYDIYLIADASVSGLITGLIYGSSSGQLHIRQSFKPNQGIWRSLYNGGRVFLIVGLILWLLYDIPVMLNYTLLINQPPSGITINFPINHLLAGIMVGIAIGLFFGLLNGGLTCIKHALLRIFLSQSGIMPRNYARFLDYAAERILLRKVGGGYIFVHRLLLDYFASLAISPAKQVPISEATSDLSSMLVIPTQVDASPGEEKASARAYSRKAGLSIEKRIALLAIVALLFLDIASSTSIVSTVQRNVQRVIAAKATASTAATATVSALHAANAIALSRANASPVPYPIKNTSPILDDPLQDNSLGYKWEVDNPGGGNCKFINHAYDIKTNSLEWCPARATDFKNFIYELQMKIVKGNEGGIAFRIDPADESRYYYFTIRQDGSYSVYDSINNYPALTQGSSPAIHSGLNQTNLLAAAVHDDIIELYVNHQRVAVVGSKTYTHGRIGVIVNGSNNPTEVIFQNAKVWKL